MIIQVLYISISGSNSVHNYQNILSKVYVLIDVDTKDIARVISLSAYRLNLPRTTKYSIRQIPAVLLKRIGIDDKYRGHYLAKEYLIREIFFIMKVILIIQSYLLFSMAKIKVGPKGQITLTKELRDKFGMNPGSLIEELETQEGILIKAVDNSFDRWAILKKKVSKKWPSDVTSVQAIQEDRTK